MRKLYVLGAALAITFSHAQVKKSFNKPSTTKTHQPYFSTLKASEIKFDQIPNFNNGVISMVDQDDDQIFLADDFQLTETTKIDKFIFYGAQSYDDLPDYYLGLKMYIFNDINGLPSGKPSDLSNAIAVIDVDETNSAAVIGTTGNEAEFTFQVNVAQALGKDLILEANKKYWVAFAPKVELSAAYGDDADETFYWVEGSANYLEPVLIDEADLFGAGATSWGTISSLTGSAFDGLAFTITGDSSLGTTDVYSNLKNVSIYPNPAVNVINLKSNRKNSITKTEIFDMNGKLVLTSSETSINVEKLPKAVYMVKIYSGSEVIETTKLIKK